LAKIKIDTERRIGRVDRGIFGGFVEHLGRCVYGGIFEEDSPLSDADGFRRDVLEILRPLRMPTLRWPGGNFVSGYRWTDGVGPLGERPRRLNLAWGVEEPNTFGTDEFVRYCRLLGTEPYVCVNMGTGTMDEAQAWVEYCNGTGDTHWANLRRRNGHEEPHGVKYWGLGNEMYGRWQIGALSAEEYVGRAREFAKVMKATDPTVRLVGCGKTGWSEWDRIVLEGLAPLVDYHSIHIYTGSDDYWSNVLAPHQAERALRSCRAIIDRVRYRQNIEHPIRVAYDEWNVWFRDRRSGSGHEGRYTLADALAVATYLNIFVRHCDTVGLANLAQMVNVIAPILTNERGLFLQTIYHPLRLYAEHTREVALDAHVDCEAHDLVSANDESASWPPHRVADLGPFKLLDVAATCDARGRDLTVAVVNRDPKRDIRASVLLADGTACGHAVAYEVNGPGWDARNSFEHQPVGVSETWLNIGKGGLEHEFPAHSLTVLKMSVG
jgi:alpha-N-arabinofuranosidase